MKCMVILKISFIVMGQHSNPYNLKNQYFPDDRYIVFKILCQQGAVQSVRPIYFNGTEY